MNGLQSTFYCEELDKLNPHTSTATLETYDGVLSFVSLGKVRHEVSLEDLLIRYDCSQDEIDEFRYALKNVGLGRTAYCRAADKVYTKDYSLKQPECEPTFYV